MTTLAQALSRGSGIERPFSCPVHGDTHPSASVNVLKGVWVCYTCRAHGTVDGAVFDDLDGGEVERELARMLREDAPTYPESWLDQFDAGLPSAYWCSRFEPQTVEHFRLGHDAVRDAATYPLRDPSGALLGVVRRALGGGTKYRYPFGVKTSELLFGYSPVAVHTVLLTEGATDAMAAWEAGFTPECGWLALACFSAMLSAAQRRLLFRIDPDRIVVGYDNDPPGRAGAAQVASVLGNDYGLARPRYPARIKDLAEMSPDQRRESLEQAVAL